MFCDDDTTIKINANDILKLKEEAEVTRELSKQIYGPCMDIIAQLANKDMIE